RIGVGRLLADAAHTGWIFVPILILYGVVYACNTAAWRLIMADEPVRPPFWRAYAITVAGFSLNFVTPMVNVGGEPFKIAAAARWLGVRRAAGSVVIYQVLHTLGMLLSFLTAIVLGLLLLPPHPARRAGACARLDPPPPLGAPAGAAPRVPAGHARPDGRADDRVLSQATAALF